MVSNPAPPTPPGDSEAEFNAALRRNAEALINARLSNTGRTIFHASRKGILFGLKLAVIGQFSFLGFGSLGEYIISPVGSIRVVFEALLCAANGLGALGVLLSALSLFAYIFIVLTRFSQFSLRSLLTVVLCLGFAGWLGTATTKAVRPLGVGFAVILLLAFLGWLYFNDPYTKTEWELVENRKRNG